VVQLVDAHANPARVPGVAVTAGTEGASGAQLINDIAITDAQGAARFIALMIASGSDSVRLRFSAPGLDAAAASAATLLGPIACNPTPLHFELGQIQRIPLSSTPGPACFDFDMGLHHDQQFLLLLENMPRTGKYRDGLFPGPDADSSFHFRLRGLPRSPEGALLATALPRVALRPRGTPERATYAWDFGAGPIYEVEPAEPPGGVPAPMLLRPHGQLLDIASAAADPRVGDTVQVWLDSIPRLQIPAGNQKAVIRHISDELIIAEDVRLGTTLRRETGGFNTPLHPDTMRAIADEYAALARVQSDMLFDRRHNFAVENTNRGRVLAVHSLMNESNLWGYTYSSGFYFVWDYWVGTDGSTGGLNQRVQRNADNLFMHEIAHMRHVGLLQHHGVNLGLRGNRWLVEGFARFSERLPVAARLLGTQEPPRTANLVLPRNPTFGTNYFRDDVPTFLNAGTSMLRGYQHSSFVFDYLADHVALQGGDWRAAVRDFLLAAGREQTLDDVVDRWTGLSFGELFTRARIALYLDDIGTPGLPAWTQYHQFQLRASRPGGTLSSSDPRVLWLQLVPGSAVEVVDRVAAGAASGFVIDGTSATGSMIFEVSGPATGNAVLSVTRIR
jgi:hypothetical protein